MLHLFLTTLHWFFKGFRACQNFPVMRSSVDKLNAFFFPFHWKKKQLCLLKKLTVIVCSWFKWIAEILCVLFSGYQTCQSEIFFRVGDFCKYIYSWKRWFLVKTLVESNFFRTEVNRQSKWEMSTCIFETFHELWFLIHCHLKLIFLCMKDAAWNDDVYLHLLELNPRLEINPLKSV